MIGVIYDNFGVIWPQTMTKKLINRCYSQKIIENV